MNKAKFKVGDRVKLSKKLQQSHNSCGTGTVTDVTTNGYRLVYTVRFDGKKFDSFLYSYELEKVEEVKKTKNYNNRKFNCGDKVKVKTGWFKGQTGTITDMSRYERLMYFVEFTETSGSWYFSYDLEPVSSKDKPIVKVEFRDEDVVFNYNYNVGDKVVVTDEAKEWIKKNVYDKLSQFSGVCSITKQTTSNVNDEVVPAYILDDVTSIVFYDDDLKPAPAPKYKVGQTVWLTPATVEQLKKDKIDIYNVYESFDIVKWFYETGKVVYKLSRIPNLLFYEDELVDTLPEVFVVQKENKQLQNYWNYICTEYVKRFCKRHDYSYDPDMWIGGDIGTLIEIADMTISMDTIRYDVDNNVPVDLFESWYWKSLELYELGVEHYMNYPSYCKGAPDEWTEERIEKLRQSHKRLEEAKADLEKTIEEYKSNEMLF